MDICMMRQCQWQECLVLLTFAWGKKPEYHELGHDARLGGGLARKIRTMTRTSRYSFKNYHKFAIMHVYGVYKYRMLCRKIAVVVAIFFHVESQASRSSPSTMVNTCNTIPCATRQSIDTKDTAGIMIFQARTNISFGFAFHRRRRSFSTAGSSCALDANSTSSLSDFFSFLAPPRSRKSTSRVRL
jgi:hypothetical protein